MATGFPHPHQAHHLQVPHIRLFDHPGALSCVFYAGFHYLIQVSMHAAKKHQEKFKK